MRYAAVDPDFRAAIERCVNQIPRGRVATCGTIARALGDPRAARAVAMWVSQHPRTPNAHRVVRADGRPILPKAEIDLSAEGAPLQGDRVDSFAILDALPEVHLLRDLRDEQVRLSAEVVERDDRERIEIVGGVDVSYDGEMMTAAAASLRIHDLRTIEIATVRGRVSFPYIPTYLAYREFPGIQAAVDRLSTPPDVLFIDGHGRLHPALFGVACYAGIRLDLPTIGVAKHPLAGRVGPSGTPRGPSPVRISGQVQGYAWIPPGRSRSIYISIGHRISLIRALKLVRLATRQGYPEPLRIADRVSRQLARNEKREKGVTR